MSLFRGKGKPEPVVCIHIQLEKTIAERNRLLPQWEKIVYSANNVLAEAIHPQLSVTIIQYKKEKHYWNMRFSASCIQGNLLNHCNN